MAVHGTILVIGTSIILLQVFGMKLSERMRLFPELYTKLGENRYAYVCRMCR